MYSVYIIYREFKQVALILSKSLTSTKELFTRNDTKDIKKLMENIFGVWRLFYVGDV